MNHRKSKKLFKYDNIYVKHAVYFKNRWGKLVQISVQRSQKYNSHFMACWHKKQTLTETTKKKVNRRNRLPNTKNGNKVTLLKQNYTSIPPLGTVARCVITARHGGKSF